VSRGLLWNWRRQVRRGTLPGAAPMFTPVQNTADPPSPIPPLVMTPTAAPSSGGPSAAASDRIEIALPDGTCVRVGADIGLATLRRVMAAVRG
jgi:transposase